MDTSSVQLTTKWYMIPKGVKRTSLVYITMWAMPDCPETQDLWAALEGQMGTVHQETVFGGHQKQSLL